MNWVAPIKDQETLKNFGETLKQVDYKYYIMFELGVGTGLQLQDILAFKNKDVTGKKEIEVTIGTRNMKNVFTVPEELQQIINEYTKGKDPEAYLILGHSSSNKPVSREQAYRVLKMCIRDSVNSLDINKKWNVHITVSEGDYISGGTIIAETQETRAIMHKSMVPPTVSGTVIKTAPDGEYTINDTIVTIKKDDGSTMNLSLTQKWPIRQPRPITKRFRCV